MFPTIFHIGPLPIRAYGVTIALSFTLGIFYGIRRAAAKGIDATVFTDLCVTILIASVVGARIAYVLPFLDEYAARPLEIFMVWEGGLTLYGGILAAIAASYIFARRKKISFPRVSDVCAPLVALGIGITRIGCFLNGCCYGIPSGDAPGIVFPPGCAAGAAYPGTPIHPAQLYDSAAGFAVFGILLLVEKRLRGDGRLFPLFLVLYGVNRYFQDMIRTYDPRAVVSLGPITATAPQVVSLLIVAGGLFFFFQRRPGGAK